MTLKLPNIPNLLFTNSRANDEGIGSSQGKIKTKRLPASAFKSILSASEPVTYVEGYVTSSGATSFGLIAPVYLPHGATILSITTYGSSTTETYTLERWDNNNSSGDTLATANVGTRNKSILYPLVDNENWGYMVKVFSLDNGDTFYGADIEYSV